MSETRKPFFFCEVCNVSCRNEGSKYSHLSGVRHLKKIEDQPGSDVAVRQDLSGPLDFRGVKAPLVGLQHLREQERNNPNQKRNFHCSLCDVGIRVESVITHVQGLKHRLEYLKKYSEADYNLISALPRSEQTVAVVSMAQKCERKNGRAKINYLRRNVQQPRNESHEYEDRNTRNKRPYFDDEPYQRKEIEPIYNDNHREGPHRKIARRNDYVEEPYRDERSRRTVPRGNYRDKLEPRDGIRDVPLNDYDDLRRRDEYRRPASDRYNELKERDVGRGREVGRDREVGREREVGRDREYEHRMPMDVENPRRIMSPPQKFPVERTLLSDDSNLKFTGGNFKAFLLSLGKFVVKNEDDAQMALQVSNALTQSLLKYRFQSMPGGVLSASISKSADNFIGNQGGMMGGFGNAQMQQNAFMNEQLVSRDQETAAQLQMQQQQLKQQLQMLQEQQNELDMKRKMKEELRHEMRPRSMDMETKHFSSARGGAPYQYDRY